MRSKLNMKITTFVMSMMLLPAIMLAANSPTTQRQNNILGLFSVGKNWRKVSLQNKN
jgi:hypothetical protein